MERAKAVMGIMFSALPTENPGEVMILLNFVRLPLLFVSGIFLPVDNLGDYWWVTIISPLTYANDLLKHAVGGTGHYSVLVDIVMLMAFTAVFLGMGVWLQERNRKSM